MNPFYRLSLMLWLLLRDLPALRPSQLVWPASLIGAWSVLHMLTDAPSTAFVLAVLAALTIQAARGLGSKVARLRSTGAGTGGLVMLIAVPVILAALQLWWFDPWITQRLLSAIIALQMGVLLVAAAFSTSLLDDIMPTRSPDKVSVEMRQHFLKVQILVWICLLAANERLMAMGAPLDHVIAFWALVPLLGCYLTALIYMMTMPLDQDTDAT